MSMFGEIKLFDSLQVYEIKEGITLHNQNILRRYWKDLEYKIKDHLEHLRLMEKIFQRIMIPLK